jgi:2-C-methyl-D-erythritol 2,4-cyclodiphosphate synthase
MRIGVGFDVHRLVEGRPLFLGGVEIPYHKGLLGHSDGDVLIHAICDAILGAISEGDIGTHFPDSDESIRGIESTRMLAGVTELAEAKGFRVLNVDAVIAAEEPKIFPYREAIRQNIGRVLKIDSDRVMVKGKTTEGLGFIGRKEGMAVYAVALLEHKEEVNG